MGSISSAEVARGFISRLPKTDHPVIRRPQASVTESPSDSSRATSAPSHQDALVPSTPSFLETDGIGTKDGTTLGRMFCARNGGFSAESVKKAMAIL